MRKAIRSLFLLFFWLCSCTEKSIAEKPEILGHTTEMKEITTSQKINSDKKIAYKKFEGAWFSIKFPENFSARNSMKSSTHSDGFDSAVFTSPDGKVQFYVFSPQWSGNPTDILVNKKTEILMDSSVEQKGKNKVKRWVIAANNGSYQRAYEETIDTESKTNQIFGIVYNPELYKDEYKKEYLHFKNSLVQYAD